MSLDHEHAPRDEASGEVFPRSSSTRVIPRLHVFIVLAVASLLCTPLFMFVGWLLPDPREWLGWQLGPTVANVLAMGQQGALNALAGVMLVADALWLVWSRMALREKAVQAAILITLLSVGWTAGVAFSVWSFEAVDRWAIVLAVGTHYLTQLLVLLLLLHLAQVAFGWELVACDDAAVRSHSQLSILALFAVVTVAAITLALFQLATRLIGDSPVVITFAEGSPEGLLYAAILTAAYAFSNVVLLVCVAFALKKRRVGAWVLAVVLPAGLQALAALGWYLRMNIQAGVTSGYSLAEHLSTNVPVLVASTVCSIVLTALVFKAFASAGYELQQLPRRSTQTDELEPRSGGM